MDGLMVDCCYDRAVKLLRDEEDVVRAAAVRLVSECGQIFAAVEEGVDKSEMMDVIFVQLCSMARDMNMKVRIEAFLSLGKVQLVSESVLVQSLTKKVPRTRTEENVLVKLSLQISKSTLPCAAGAFVHGVEDEFYEVRTAACKSLGMLTNLSIKFADDGLNMLMDMLNDDATVVRVQTLQALLHMAEGGRLTMQERHLDMFLGLLADISALIRSAGRKVLRLMRLPELKIFKPAIDGLITNMETYPEEEEDIFFVLFFIGKNHGKFAAKLAKQLSKKLDLSSDGDLSLDSPRVAALLVLAISSPFSDKQLVHEIPLSLFSYAIPLLGRISRSLRHIINEDSLLAYLWHHSGILPPARPPSPRAEFLPPIDEESISKSSLIHKEISKNMFNQSEVSYLTPLEQVHQKGGILDEEILQSIKLILKTVAGTWLLIRSNFTFEARRVLRSCIEELETIAWNADSAASAILSFASQYVLIIQLFADIWEQVKPKRSHLVGMVSLDLLLEKLDTSLRIMRYGFSGLSKGEECHILELTLFSHVLKVHKSSTCLDLKMLLETLSRLHLSKEGSLSNFAKELHNLCSEHRVSGTANLLDLFLVEEMHFTGRLRQITAELEVIGNDSENPLLFVSGLPVGISFQVSLYSVPESGRLWVRMAAGELIQYVFLDLCQVSKGVVSVPFYGALRAAAFILRCCICMECPLEYGRGLKKGQGGPRNDTIPICKETDVYLVKIENG